MTSPEHGDGPRLDGRPAGEWIRDRRRELVARAMEALSPVVSTRPDETAELQWIVDYNVALFTDLLEHPGTRLDEVRAADLVASATNRAAEGSAIESLLHDYVAGSGAIWRAMAGMVEDRTGRDFDEVTAAFFDYLRGVLVLVARGFEHEASRISAGRRDARFAVYSALIEGADAAHVAARAAVPLAPRYLVLALRFGVAPEPARDGRSVAVPRLRRINEAQRVLEELATGDLLSLIRDPTGTVLVPLSAIEPDPDRARLSALAERLQSVAGVSVHLGAAVADVDDVPVALEQAEDILELVTAIGRPPGIWLLEDVLLPYQLTRPGPARDALARRLEVLDGHPDWELTIRTHLASGSDRNRTARALQVHPNTVDYRLRRFAEATGLEPGNPALAAATQAAVWVRDLVRARGVL